MIVPVFTDERMLRHDAGEGHPERPERLAALLSALRERPIPGVELRAAPPATRAQLTRVHWPSYIDLVESARGEYAEFDPDTLTCPSSVEAAWLAAGAAVAAVETACAGGRAFALVRPPGHHAERGRAMGFCLFNNVAIAAEHARSLGVERVLVVDWDVHHGNGTQHHFEERADVLFFSTHQGNFYPGTGGMGERGRGAGLGFTLNMPLPPRSGDAELACAFAELLVPAAERFRPELVLVSAGFDAHAEDPLAQLEATEAGFSHLCGVVCRLADQHAASRVALVLEGGYALGALERSVRACLEVLCGGEPAPVPPADAAARALIRSHPALRG